MKDNIEDLEKLEQDKHIEKVYTEKTAKTLKIAIGFLIFSIISYGYYFFLGYYDFGIFFELIAFICILVAINSINKKLIAKAKINLIIAIIFVSWLLIYDFINFIAHIEQILDIVLLLNFFDWFLFIVFMLVLLSFKTLCDSQKGIQYISNKNWFYDEK